MINNLNLSSLVLFSPVLATSYIAHELSVYLTPLCKIDKIRSYIYYILPMKFINHFIYQKKYTSHEVYIYIYKTSHGGFLKLQ